MNELTIAQKLIGFLGCGVLSVGVVALLVVSCRNQLIAVLERFGRLNAFVRVMACGALVMLTLYGGAKHYMPTNTPPDDASSPTNAPMMLGLGLRSRPTMEYPNLHCTTTTSDYTSIPNWTARGAYCDWRRIDFPDAFQFPVGTNVIEAVTLFAWGEVKVRGEGEQRNLSSDSAGQPEQEGDILCSPSPSTLHLALQQPRRRHQRRGIPFDPRLHVCASRADRRRRPAGGRGDAFAGRAVPVALPPDPQVA